MAKKIMATLMIMVTDNKMVMVTMMMKKMMITVMISMIIVTDDYCDNVNNFGDDNYGDDVCC